MNVRDKYTTLEKIRFAYALLEVQLASGLFAYLLYIAN